MLARNMAFPTGVANASDTDGVVDVIDLSFKVIDGAIRRAGWDYRAGKRATLEPDDAINEFNQRFRQHLIGYQFVMVKGACPVEVPDDFAAYALHLATSNILLLIQCTQGSPVTALETFCGTALQP